MAANLARAARSAAPVPDACPCGQRSNQRQPLAFAGLVTIGAMAMAMYELFSVVEKRTTGWAHRGSQNH